jgi:hypothetical protein
LRPTTRNHFQRTLLEDAEMLSLNRVLRGRDSDPFLGAQSQKMLYVGIDLYSIPFSGQDLLSPARGGDKREGLWIMRKLSAGFEPFPPALISDR